MVITDPKLELYNETKELAYSRYDNVICFAKGHDSFNPLSPIKDAYINKPIEVVSELIELLTETLCPVPKDAGTNEYFYQRAQEIVKG
jgi:hypothetical protein